MKSLLWNPWVVEVILPSLDQQHREVPIESRLDRMSVLMSCQVSMNVYKPPATATSTSSGIVMVNEVESSAQFKV